MCRFSAALFACMVAIPVQAQECSQILSQGIYDIRSSASDLNTASSFSQWFCDKKFSSSQQANDFGASLAFPFKGIPIKLGFDSSSQSWSEWYSSFCGKVQHDQSLQSRVREHVQTVNPQIIQAFNSCIASDGLHVWLERTYDPKRFRFAARFNPPTATNTKATFEAFRPGSNVACDDMPTTVSRPVWRTECKRKNDDAVSMYVRADWNPSGGGQLDLSAIEPAPPPPEIITATLDVILCSGANCQLPHIKKGGWQVVRWEASRNATRGLGPQLAIPEDITRTVFCVSPDKVTASAFKGAARSANFRVTDNIEQTGYFDLNDEVTSYFEYANLGRFYFVNNYENEINHHIRLDISLALASSYARR